MSATGLGTDTAGATASVTGSGPAGSAHRPGSSEQHELLSPLTPGGLDLVVARAKVDAAATARRRGRRILAGTCAAFVVIAGCVGVSLLGGTAPDDIVADGDQPSERSTTTLTTTTAPPVDSEVAVAPTELTVATLVPTTTTTTPVAPTEPLPVAPPATAPPPPPQNQPLQVELTVVTPTTEAGDVARVDLAWRDPDHSGATPHVSIDWGDPAISVDAAVPPSGPCDLPGAPSGGTAQLLFRYATPGVHQLGVTVSTCDGLGAYGERVRAIATVTVSEPAGGAERAVVAFVPREVGTQEPVLDDAVAELLAPDATVTPLADRRPVLRQFTAGGSATVLRVPVDAVGTVRATWPGPTGCIATGAIDLPTVPPGQVPQIALQRTC